MNVKHLKPFSESEWERFPQAERWDDGVEPYWAAMVIGECPRYRKDEARSIARDAKQQRERQHYDKSYFEESCIMVVDKAGITISGEHGRLQMKVADRYRALPIAEVYLAIQPVSLGLLRSDGIHPPLSFEGGWNPS